MKRFRTFGLAACASSIMGLTMIALPPRAHAEDFFSALFRAFSGHRSAPSSAQGPFNFAPDQPQYSSRRSAGSGSAYCVRTCDGRYFPAPPAGNYSRAQACNSFCPAAETKVVYGSSIDDAATENGKAYADLPNAYKFRSQLVAGCSCNGTDPVGLAKVKIDDDKTLRRGDLVVAPDGVKVATGRADAQGASAELAPAPPSVRARFERRPSVAANQRNNDRIN